MKKYKLKQNIAVPIIGSSVIIIIVKAEAILHEDSGYAYFTKSGDIFNKVLFDKHSVESTPELFELVTEEAK